MATGMLDPNKTCEKVVPYSTWNPNRYLASGYTMSGPTSGLNGVASTNFTVALPSGVAVPTDVSVVVTPADSGTGTAGVFTPTSLKLDELNRSKTFTYTPGSTGVKVISVTNTLSPPVDGMVLTNPANISYTSS